MLNEFGARGRQRSVRGCGRLWGWLRSLTPTGLKTGHYTLNEYGGRVGQGSVWRWGRLRGWLGSLTPTDLKTGHYRGSLIRWRLGWWGGLAMVEVLADGIADGPAPRVVAEGVDVLVLGKRGGLGESLGEIGEGAGGAGLNVAADDGGQEAAEGGAEIAGGKVFAGEEIGQFAGEFIGGGGLGVFAGVVGVEVGMMGGAGSAALAAIGEGETTQGLAVLWAKRGHRWLLKLSWK